MAEKPGGVVTFQGAEVLIAVVAGEFEGEGGVGGGGVAEGGGLEAGVEGAGLRPGRRSPPGPDLRSKVLDGGLARRGLASQGVKVLLTG